jgi:glutamate-1-semialdehyde 2,1-aminomutase
MDDLQHALAEAQKKFIARNPKSAVQLESTARFMPGGNTRTAIYFDPFPLVITRGEGCRLWDLDGHEYIDFLGEFTAGIYGHSNPIVIEAIKSAVDNGLNLAGHTVLEAKFAAAVCARFPQLELIRFTNSGTEANLMALAVAKAFTKRQKILVFAGGYHGGVLSFIKGMSPVNVPHDFIIGAYNDVESAADLIQRHGADLAAILVEPMQGSGGCIPASKEFVDALRTHAAACGAILIFDEVMTSRLSSSGLQPALGVQADLTTLGKYIGGGSSIGAFGGRADIMSLFDPRRPDALAHAGTFNNNVISMAAGIAGLTEVYTPENAAALNARGDAFRTKLNALCAAAGAPMQCTGIGSMINFHATTRPIKNVSDLASANMPLRDLLFFDLLENGIYLAKRGFMALSLPIGNREIAAFIGVFERFLQERKPLFAPASTINAA